MKNSITSVCPALIVLALTATISTAQTVVYASRQGNEVALSKDTTAELKSFSAKYNSGKIYINWSVANQHEDGVYIIYSSCDGKNYEVAGQKKGIGVPISQEITYYFIDELPCNETVYYKILHVGKSNDFLMSEKVMVTSAGKLLSQTF